MLQQPMQRAQDPAQPQAAGSKAGPAHPPAGPEVNSSPTTGLGLRLTEDGSLVAGPGGTVLLQDLPAGASLRPYAGGAVVGLSSGRTPGTLLDLPLGKLPPGRRFLALSKAKQYWMVPAWGSSAAEVPIETQLLLLEAAGEQAEEGQGAGEAVYALLLPLIDGNRFRGSLRPPRRENAVPHDTLLVRMESGDDAVVDNSFANAVYIQAGPDPYRLLDEGLDAAVKLSGSGRMRWEKPQPPTLDVFGWCTWDAMWTDVCPRGITEGLRLLREGGTPAMLLIIDDGWQQTGVDPEFQADAEEWQKLHTSGELEVEYNVARLVSGEDEQITEPLRHRQQEEQEREQGEGQGQQEGGGGAEAFQEQDGVVGLEGMEELGGGKASSSWMARVSRLLRRALQRCEIVAIGAVRDAVEAAPSGSLLLRIFAALMRGPLRRPVLRFYAQASCHSRRLLSVRANGKFSALDSGPEAPLESASSGFGEVVRAVKERYGVQYVYCWHAMAGYWSGIMPGAPGTARYGSSIRYPRPSPGTLEVDPSFTWVQPVIAGIGLPEDPRPFHNDLHAYLKECGVDGVKVDVEATLCMFGHSGRGGHAAMGARWHGSLEGSVAQHLGGQAINSMCCSTEDLYNMSSSNIARCSEDFYPLIKASHWAHVANSAFVTLMVGSISHPCWDMFHSAHDAAHLHATARAVSGGMVYVSDKMGDHDFGLLRRLVLPDGSTLRCCLPGRPALDCLMRDVSRDGRTVLKVWNMNRCSGVVGLFNVQGATWRIGLRNYHQHDPAPPALTARVSPRDVPLLPAAERYAAYSDARQELRLLGARDSWELEVAGGGGHDLITLAPVLECNGVTVAAVGLVNMLNAGGAVRGLELQETQEGATNGHRGCLASVRLHGCGTLLLHASRPPVSAKVDGEPAAEEYDAACQAVRVEVPEEASMSREVVLLF